MLHKVKNTQAVADRLKVMLPMNTPDQRRANEIAYLALHQFEGAKWNLQAFTTAMRMTNRVFDLRTLESEDTISFSVNPQSHAPATISYLLGAYLGILQGEEKAANHAE